MGIVPADGFTLIEVLVATALSLLLLSGVVLMFARVGESVTAARAMLESADRLRLTAARLQQDLAGLTVDLSKVWHRPEDNEGYFEYIEGPVGPAALPGSVAKTTDTGVSPPPDDTTVGDFDDILMFTTRSTGEPFRGRVPTAVNPSGSIQSDVAEVAWFIRGRTLYRRVLLVVPALLQQLDTNHNGYLDHDGTNASAELALLANTGFYSAYDVSARPVLDSSGNLLGYVPNTLGDLTRRECRFAHLTHFDSTLHAFTFPYDVRLWCWQTGSPAITIPTLPTLRECSSTSSPPPPPPWTIGATVPPALTPNITSLDFWSNDPNRRLTDAQLFSGSNATRIADEVILTNVIGFDVKAWDPTANSGAGAYVDLGYLGSTYPANANTLGHYGAPNSSLTGSATAARVYDTWPNTYEYTGTSVGDTRAGRAFNGLDDDNNGIVDDSGELITSPPYPVPLRGIQVKIRVFEPDSRQVREVTVVQDFLPQ